MPPLSNAALRVPVERWLFIVFLSLLNGTAVNIQVGRVFITTVTSEICPWAGRTSQRCECRWDFSPRRMNCEVFQSTPVSHHLKCKVRRSNFYIITDIRMLFYWFCSGSKMCHCNLAFRGRECPTWTPDFWSRSCGTPFTSPQSLLWTPIRTVTCPSYSKLSQWNRACSFVLFCS